MYRSTKGASKARRDQINAEIRNLKELLPISEAEKARLSYLHIMSLACMYTRKSVFFSQESETSGGQEGSSSFMSFQELSRLVHELPGFLLMLTSEGKLLYLSDSVTEHLGHSMVDLVAQGDSVYDIIDPTDHFVMRSNLSPTTSADTDRLFRCRFHTSKSARRQSAGTRLTLVRAHCLSTPGTAASYWTSNPAWLCFCSPLEGQPCSPGTPPTLAPPADHAFFLAGFHSRHSHDMRVQDADDSVSLYLGYDVDALRARSWYSLLHPQDLPHASAQHCCLLGEGGEGRAEMVVRVQMQDSTFTWLYMVLHLETGDSPISCRSYVVSEAEACSVRQQLCTEQAQLALVLSASASYQDSLGLRSPDTLSSPDQVFTPSSGGLSGQSFDFTSLSSSEEPGGAVTSLEEEAFPQQQAPPPLEPGQSPSRRDSAHLYCRQHGLAAAESVPTPLSDAASPPASQNASARGGVRLHRAPLCPPGRKGRGYVHGLLTPRPRPRSGPSPWRGRRELEQERAEISYLAQQISSLAEQLSSASSSGSAPLSNTPPLGRDPVSPLAEMFHPVKRLTGRVGGPARSLDEGSLFEQSALQSLLLPLAPTPPRGVAGAEPQQARKKRSSWRRSPPPSQSARLRLPRSPPPSPRPVCLAPSPPSESWSPWNPCLGQEPQLPLSWGNNLSCINSTVTPPHNTFSQPVGLLLCYMNNSTTCRPYVVLQPSETGSFRGQSGVGFGGAVSPKLVCSCQPSDLLTASLVLF
ncbi:hypothetical protein COCON_G00072120 [Conger conger]|uniref:Neuronal PAS domain-containing protein 4 n=1 Tax=Conger conger TaxID=82655 RepID=A0A9Q1DMY2_CONCO|nr:hypothetical protein COCON_G00072120 [Conger conger]